MAFQRFTAPLFVVLWSTGFIGTKYGLPFADPLSFLFVRFGLVALLFVMIVLIARAPWPSWDQVWDQVLIGILMQVGYLGGVFIAIWLGTEAGIAALVTGLQPISTALLAYIFLKERLVRTQWLGMALGLGGVMLVVMQKLSHGVGDAWGILLCLGALIAISTGSILQKARASQTPMRSGTAIQYMTAFFVLAPLMLIIQPAPIIWSTEFILALAWLTFVLSFGAINLLYILIRRGGASNVASLFFLVPPCTALLAWVLFGETLNWVGLIGIAITALGVLLVNQPRIFTNFRVTI